MPMMRRQRGPHSAGLGQQFRPGRWFFLFLASSLATSGSGDAHGQVVDAVAEKNFEGLWSPESRVDEERRLPEDIMISGAIIFGLAIVMAGLAGVKGGSMEAGMAGGFEKIGHLG